MLAQMVTEYVRGLYDAGKTQEQIARELHTDHPTINRLLSGKIKGENLKIGTFDKMFPAATVSLTGGGVTVGDHNAGPVAGIHAGDNFFSPPPGGAPVPPEVGAVLSSALPAAEKAAILRALYHPQESEVQK